MSPFTWPISPRPRLRQPGTSAPLSPSSSSTSGSQVREKAMRFPPDRLLGGLGIDCHHGHAGCGNAAGSGRQVAVGGFLARLNDMVAEAVLQLELVLRGLVVLHRIRACRAGGASLSH